MSLSLMLTPDTFIISKSNKKADGTIVSKSFEGNASQYLLHTSSKIIKAAAGEGVKASIVQHGQYKPFMQAVLTGFVPVLTARQRENVEHNITGILAGMREESPGKTPSLYNKLSCLAVCAAITAAFSEKEDPKGVKLVYLEAARAFADKASRKAATIENAYTVVVA